MTRNIAIEIQDFGTLVCNKYFYIDKTSYATGLYRKELTHKFCIN